MGNRISKLAVAGGVFTSAEASNYNGVELEAISPVETPLNLLQLEMKGHIESLMNYLRWRLNL